MRWTAMVGACPATRAYARRSAASCPASCGVAEHGVQPPVHLGDRRPYLARRQPYPAERPGQVAVYFGQGCAEKARLGDEIPLDRRDVRGRRPGQGTYALRGQLPALGGSGHEPLEDAQDHRLPAGELTGRRSQQTGHVTATDPGQAAVNVEIRVGSGGQPPEQLEDVTFAEHDAGVALFGGDESGRCGRVELDAGLQGQAQAGRRPSAAGEQVQQALHQFAVALGRVDRDRADPRDARRGQLGRRVGPHPEQHLVVLHPVAVVDGEHGVQQGRIGVEHHRGLRHPHRVRCAVLPGVPALSRQPSA
jgi:hypothetical protein